MKKLLHWAPRILGIISIIFISLFALDAFQEGASALAMSLGFIIHLIPSILLLIFLLIAWKWELVGGIIFILISFIPFLALSNPVWVNGMLSIPFAFTGILFILSFWYSHRQQKISL